MVIGYLDNPLPRNSQELQDLIVESWLVSFPAADLSITNLGGIRDDLPAGEVRLTDIISVMPFDNTMVEIRLTGSEIKQVLQRGKSPAVGGLTRSGGDWVFKASGEPLEDENTYIVLVNDFIYAGGDDYGLSF